MATIREAVEQLEQTQQARQKLGDAETAVLRALNFANKTPAYHSYVERLGQILHELIDMRRMA